MLWVPYGYLQRSSIRALELEFQVMVRCSAQVLGGGSRSSIKPAKVLNNRAIFPAPVVNALVATFKKKTKKRGRGGERLRE